MKRALSASQRCRLLPGLMIAATLLLGTVCSARDGRPASERVFRAGAATSNITPPLGELIVGNWEPIPAKYVHDELHARCLVLDDGQQTLAFVIADNVGIPREVFDAARSLIHKETELPPSNVLFAATHTHSATTARNENKAIARTEFTDYQQFLIRRMADVVRIALGNLEPARIGWGSVDVPEEVFNRRWFMTGPEKDLRNPFGGVDQVRMNPPRASAGLLRPAGPVDPEVAFLSVQSVDGRPIALLANYSLHYVGGVPAGHVSADYFAVFAERIGELLNARDHDSGDQSPPFVGIMSNGTSGNINNINFREKSRSYKPYEKMREVADRVAQRVAEAHASIEFHDWVPLDVRAAELPLHVRKPDAEMLSWADRILSQPEGAVTWHSRERIYAERVKMIAEAPDEVSVLLQTFRIGDLGIAAIPFETFVESGVELKQKGPFAQTFTIELANGSFGYLPTPEQHEVGGYETWLGTNYVEKTATVKIVDQLLGMFASLRESSTTNAAGEVVTIAGTGEPRYFGDGGPAVQAGVGGPFGVVVGPDGAIYVCEISNHVVRRIDPETGVITTVAGTGEKGYSGDGGPATEAMLNEPYEVRFDAGGNMLFVDMMAAVVRRVDAQTGIITTVAGTGEPGFSGDGGPATKARLKQPHSIALDNDQNLYICDIGNHRIRRVDLDSGIITTFAGTGDTGQTPDGAPLAGTPLNGPRALDFDGQHSLYLALREGNAVYRLDLSTSTLHHLAGTGEKGYAGDGGSAKDAVLAGPKGIALGPNGDIYLADTESHTIRVIRHNSGIIETLVGDGAKGDGPDGAPRGCRLERPHGIFVDAHGNVYIGDSSNHKVRVLCAE